MKRLMRKDLEIEVLGFKLTIRRIILVAVMACLLVLAFVMISELFDEETPEPPLDPDTGRYEESDPNWPLCAVFIFLGIVVIAFITLEVRS